MKLVGDEIDDFVVILESIDEGTKVSTATVKHLIPYCDLGGY